MTNEFKVNFTDFVDNAVMGIGNNLIKTNLEYVNLSNDSIKLFHEIKTLLPIEYQHLINKYEQTLLLLQDISIHIAYKQGFKNGIEFLVLLEKAK